MIGDAAHAMSPQLGLGSTLAVQDALVLAGAVEEHGPVAGAAAYSRQRLCAVRNYQMLSKALTPCFQADSGGLWRDMMFAAGLKFPGIPRLMYRSIAAPPAKKNPSGRSTGVAEGVSCCRPQGRQRMGSVHRPGTDLTCCGDTARPPRTARW